MWQCCTIYVKKFIYGTNISLLQLKPKQICTIQARNLIYGTNISLFNLKSEQICTIRARNFIYGTDTSLFQLKLVEICTIWERITVYGTNISFTRCLFAFRLRYMLMTLCRAMLIFYFPMYLSLNAKKSCIPILFSTKI